VLYFLFLQLVMIWKHFFQHAKMEASDC
jgi:hypothetical protein